MGESVVPLKLSQAVAHYARATPDALATSCAGRRRTWSELRDRVSRLAAGLVSLGVGSEDRVGVLANNADYFYESTLAIWWAAAATNLVNIRWSAAEIAYSLDDCNTGILIVDGSYAALIPDVIRLSSSLKRVIYIGEDGFAPEYIKYEALIAESEPIVDMEQDEAALAGIFYTGGTTGFPKGVALTQRSIVSNTLINLMEMPLGPDDVVLAVAPMFHLAGLCIVIRALLRGAPCAFVPGFDERSFIDTVEMERATFTLVVPVMIQRLLDFPAEDLAVRLRSLRMVQYGGSPIGETLLRKVIERLPDLRLVQGYGMTETSGPCTILPSEFHRRIDGTRANRLQSAGRPVWGVELRITDRNGSELPTGEIGEVICRGPVTMEGYWNQAEMTAAALRDGWMHSGDIGYVDGNGYLFIVDRLKDMIVSGGENVFSAEVENALAKHPAVATCAVIGIPSDRWGEQVHAVVALHPDAEVAPEALRAHCKLHIAGYKCPVSIEFRDALPYSGAGKVQKNLLREPYWEQQGKRVS